MSTDHTPGVAGLITDSLPGWEKHTGQVRGAYLLARDYKHRLLFVYGIGWHYWDGTRWAYDDVGATKRAVLDTLDNAWTEARDDKQLQADIRKCESAAGVAGVLSIASALTEFAATVRNLDANPYLLNCANGTLDLHTGQLRAHNPADRITRMCRAAYQPAASGPTWTAFLEQVLPEREVRAFVQRLAGLALIGQVREHLLAILAGTGANGKSVFCAALLDTFGDYGSTAEPDLFMHRQGAHPTGEMDLMGRRLIVVSESERDRRLAEATMKRLTGGDTIRARRMRQDFVEFQPTHTAVLTTNHLPRVSGDDPAIWRRLRVVPFTVEIPPADRDPGLGDKLRLEREAVLAWAVTGLAAYQEGGLAEPAAVTAATTQYQRDSDAVARFIADRCTDTCTQTTRATTEQLHIAFERWRATDGAEPLSLRAFGLALDRAGHPAKKDGNKRWRQGIGLLPELDRGQ